MSAPALVGHVDGKIHAVVENVLQVWVRGRVRKFGRACRLCLGRVNIGEMCWRPGSNIAPNRADRVCSKCWGP
jgi:hypothetical protein